MMFGIKDIFDFQKSAKVSAALLSHERERERRSFLLRGSASASAALFFERERERKRRSKNLGALKGLTCLKGHMQYQSGFLMHYI